MFISSLKNNSTYQYLRPGGGTNQDIQEVLWKYENIGILGFMIYGNTLVVKTETVLQI